MGTVQFAQHGVVVTDQLRVEIEETKKKDALRCVYTYGEKGKKGYSRDIRRITLHPDTSEMTSEWNDDIREDRYKTVGLDRFADTGLGTFVANISSVEQGKAVIWRRVFYLSKGKLEYRVGEALDGRTFRTTNVTTLSRESPSP